MGELARERYPGGVLVDVEDFKVAEGLDRTTTLLAEPAVAVLYEGSIAFDDVAVRPIRAALLKYCERDTLAMVKLRKALCSKMGA